MFSGSAYTLPRYVYARARRYTGSVPGWKAKAPHGHVQVAFSRPLVRESPNPRGCVHGCRTTRRRPDQPDACSSAWTQQRTSRGADATLPYRPRFTELWRHPPMHEPLVGRSCALAPGRTSRLGPRRLGAEADGSRPQGRQSGTRRREPGSGSSSAEALRVASRPRAIGEVVDLGPTPRAGTGSGRCKDPLRFGRQVIETRSFERPLDRLDFPRFRRHLDASGLRPGKGWVWCRERGVRKAVARPAGAGTQMESSGQAAAAP